MEPTSMAHGIDCWKSAAALSLDQLPPELAVVEAQAAIQQRLIISLHAIVIDKAD
jgi:hypothetical protein